MSEEEYPDKNAELNDESKCIIGLIINSDFRKNIIDNLEKNNIGEAIKKAGLEVSDDFIQKLEAYHADKGLHNLENIPIKEINENLQDLISVGCFFW